VSKVVLKDKKDMNHLFQFEGYENWDEITDNGLEWEDYKIMGSQDVIKRNLETEVLSVKFSKIGQKTFEAYPNLKWIQCRAHGSDNINLELAESHRVGVVCLDPDTYNVANWVCKFTTLGKTPLILGAGKIGKQVASSMVMIESGSWNGVRHDPIMITSKTTHDPKFSKNFDTIVVTSSPTEKPILNRELLENFRGNIISISRPACIDNEALLEAVNDGRVYNAQMDMLDPKGRDELIATGKVKYHGHTAWQANGVTQYDERYFCMVFGEIRWLLRNDPQYDPPVRNSRVVLERKPNSLFGD